MDDKETITITIEEYNLLLEKQKQEDELENRFENKACCNMSENCSMIQQAVKDTAKEILQEIGNIWDDNGEFMFRDYQWYKNLCERYGVEVEW